MLGTEYFSSEGISLKFESQNIKSKYSLNVGTDKWKEPRMLTLDQVRNVVFSMLNQSQFREELDIVQYQATQLKSATERLNQRDDSIDQKYGQAVD